MGSNTKARPDSVGETQFWNVESRVVVISGIEYFGPFFCRRCLWCFDPTWVRVKIT